MPRHLALRAVPNTARIVRLQFTRKLREAYLYGSGTLAATAIMAVHAAAAALTGDGTLAATFRFARIVGTPATNADTSTGTSRNISLPSGITAGERIVIIITADQVGVTFTPPSGFSKITGSEVTSSCSGVAFEKKVASGSESGTINCNASLSLGASAAIAMRVAGAHATQAGEAATTNSGGSSAPNPPSVTPSWGNEQNCWIAAAGCRGNRTVSSYPASYPSGQTQISTGASAMTAIAARAFPATTEDPAAYALSGSSPVYGMTIAIRAA